MALGLALADHAAKALYAELSVAEMQDICVSAWLVALGRGWPGGPINGLSNLVLYEYGSADPHLSWLVTVSLKPHSLRLEKTKVEKEYGYQPNNNLLGKHQGKRRII